MPLTKDEIAARLKEIGAYLRLVGQDPYRARAYENAGDALDALGPEFEVLVDSERMTEVPGIGASIAGVIGELRRTGSTRKLEELRAEFPPSLLELAQVPGHDHHPGEGAARGPGDRGPGRSPAGGCRGEAARAEGLRGQDRAEDPRGHRALPQPPRAPAPDRRPGHRLAAGPAPAGRPRGGGAGDRRGRPPLEGDRRYVADGGLGRRARPGAGRADRRRRPRPRGGARGRSVAGRAAAGAAAAARRPAAGADRRPAGAVRQRAGAHDRVEGARRSAGAAGSAGRTGPGGAGRARRGRGLCRPGTALHPARAARGRR